MVDVFQEVPTSQNEGDQEVSLQPRPSAEVGKPCRIAWLRQSGLTMISKGKLWTKIRRLDGAKEARLMSGMSV